MKVYVASPLGFTEPGRRYSEAVLLPALRAAGLEPLDPWADPEGRVAAELARARTLPEPQRRLALAALNARLGAANEASIDAADAVLALLDGPDVDSGTAAEIAYARARDTPVIGLRTDWRTSGDNDGATVNLQVEHFVRASGGRLTASLEEAVSALQGLRR